MEITRMRTNRMKNPLGFSMRRARLSYTVEETQAQHQRAARVLVALDAAMTNPVWDSGEDAEIDSICCEVPLTLAPCTRYYWKVWVWAENGEQAESKTAWFETAKAPDAPWTGRFITQSFAQNIHPVFVKTLHIEKPVHSARIDVLGLGVYELLCNGAAVSNEVLLPGIHAYDSWLQYQTFALGLHEGDNLLEAALGDGWYKGPYGLKSKLPRHGEEYALIADVRVTYTDGTQETFGTDLSWKARPGCVVEDSIYDGETYDARVQQTENALQPVRYATQTETLTTAHLQARLSPPILIHERLKPIALLHTPAGEAVLDMGQNMVGWAEFTVRAPSGTKIVLQYGEILQGGNFYRDNLRKAKCEYTYIAHGSADGKPETARAHFTFFGFRYIKVSGWPEAETPLCAENFTGCVIHSQMEETGVIRTDNALVNRLAENVRWGQKGNFLDTPTDCPQRDERMGWTGDAQIFADTACFNMDTYAFYTKFCKDLAYEQEKCGGSVPYVVPMSRYELNGATVWGDAATVIPWQTYVHFGDAEILRAQYPSMKAWVEYIKRADDATGARRLWTTGRHFGDWLALDGKVDGGVYGSTDAAFISSAYYYHSAVLVAKAARVLGIAGEADAYEALAKEIKAAFAAEFFTPSGRLSVDTQTGFAVAIALELVPPQAWRRVCTDFKEKLKDNGFMLNTGFVGTPLLCPALSEAGWDDAAWDLLLNEAYPGWLYEVKQGATTIWERWNSVLPDGNISGTGMNSLNHYAYGSVEAWMYRYMLGIRPVEDAPGFRKAILAPTPSHRLGSAQGSLQTPAGLYRVAWTLNAQATPQTLAIAVKIPFGACAQLLLPRAAGQRVACEGIAENAFAAQGDCLTAALGAGTYRFTYTPSQPYRVKPGLDSNWNDLMRDPQIAATILQYFPRAKEEIPFQDEGTTLDEIVSSPFSEISDEALQALLLALKNF